MNSEMMTFVGPTFTIDVPTDWVTGASAQFQAVFRSPEPDGEVYPNLVMAIRTVEDDVTLLSTLKVARETQEKEYPDYRMLSQSPVAVGPVAGVRRVFEWQPPGQKGAVQQQQVSFLDGSNLYTLTTSRMAESENDAELDHLFEHMLGSFEFRTDLVAT